MKALVFEHGELQLVERPVPVPQVDELLIKVLMAGICNTDLEIMAGYVDFQGVLGHEFVGVVENDPIGQLHGQRVVGSINIPCKHCVLCQAGLRSHCEQRHTLGIHGKDGVFAEFITLPRENLYPVPEVIPNEQAVLVEPIAAALEILEQVYIPPTQEIVVLGDGKLGLLIAYVLWAMGYNVNVIGKHPEKLHILAPLKIKTHLVGEFTRPTDVVVECTGSHKGLETALSLVKPRGILVLKTTTADTYTFNLSRVVVNEINIIGSRCGPFAPALRLLQRTPWELAGYIDSVFPLHEGIKGFARVKEPGVLKVLVKIPA